MKIHCTSLQKIFKEAPSSLEWVKHHWGTYHMALKCNPVIIIVAHNDLYLIWNNTLSTPNSSLDRSSNYGKVPCTIIYIYFTVWTLVSFGYMSFFFWEPCRRSTAKSFKQHYQNHNPKTDGMNTEIVCMTLEACWGTTDFITWEKESSSVSRATLLWVSVWMKSFWGL